MLLQFGEGAAKHRDRIELAVEKWNEALEGFNRKLVIELVARKPRNYFLPGEFWHHPYEESDRLSTDGESVIYFKSQAFDDSPSGFVHPRTDGNGGMAEADIYINTTDWEEYGPHLFHAQEVLDLDDKIIYVTVDAVYKTILHEIGHALGLGHVPVSGNIMSYNYMPYMRDRWSTPVTMDFFRQIVYADPSDLFTQGVFQPFIWNGDDLYPYQYRDEPSTLEASMIWYFTMSAGLGEQDRMSLLCAYEFRDWNHEN